MNIEEIFNIIAASIIGGLMLVLGYCMHIASSHPVDKNTKADSN